MNEIIKRVGGGDMTTGSCSSVALAYIANDCRLEFQILEEAKVLIILMSS